MKEIKKSITITKRLDIVQDGDRLILGSGQALQTVVGSKAAAGDIHLHGIEKTNDGYWIVPISVVRDRIRVKTNRYLKELDEVKVMQEILDQCDKVSINDKNKKKRKK